MEFTFRHSEIAKHFFTFWKYINWRQGQRGRELASGFEGVCVVKYLGGAGPETQGARRVLVSAVLSDESQNNEQSPRESAFCLKRGCERSILNSSAFQAFWALISLSHLFPFNVFSEPCPSTIPWPLPLPLLHVFGFCFPQEYWQQFTRSNRKNTREMTGLFDPELTLVFV